MRNNLSNNLTGEFRIKQLGLYSCAIVCAATLLSCSFDPSAVEPVTESSSSTAVRPVAARGSGDLSGEVKADEFNDLATGNETPVQGGQVVVQFLSEPDSLNPLTDNSAVNSYITDYIFSTLLRRNPETFEWEPSLAERWIEEDVVVKKDGSKLRGKVSFSGPGETGDIALKTSSGGSLRMASAEVQEVRRGASFTFFMRRNAKFHDGHSVTADDIKFTYDTIRNETVDAPSLRAYYADMESCEILDNYTVRLTYGKQYWEARAFAGGFPIVPRHIYDPDGLIDKDPQAFGKHFNEGAHNRNPVGSGPYKFERFDTGIQVALRRNDDYWAETRRGYLDRIIIKFISDPVAALQSLKNGDVNFVTRIRAEQFEEETRNPAFEERFAKVEYYTPAFSYVGWNMRRPPFNDPKVRLAMAYGAVNVQEYLDRILYGRGVRVAAYQYVFGPVADPTLNPYPYDPEKAKQLLLETGWYDRDGDGIRDKNGQPFRFEFLQASGGTSRLAPFMKESLRKLGIDMSIRELEWATFLQNIYDRQFDACALSWAMDPESDLYQIWHTSQKENRGSNHVGFGDQETDRLIEESRRTIDDQARRELFRKFDHILYEQQPYLFLYTAPDLGAYDKRYRGVKFYKLRPGYDFTDWFLPAEAQTAAANQ
jgi:peptide/nickel transport system substrate-binding protein